MLIGHKYAYRWVQRPYLFNMYTFIMELRFNYKKGKKLHIDIFENYANYLINMRGVSPKSSQVMTVVIPIYLVSFIKIRQTVLAETC